MTKGVTTHDKRPDNRKSKRKHVLQVKAITLPLKKENLAETVESDQNTWEKNSDYNQDSDSSWYGQFVKYVMSILMNIILIVKINF